MPPATTSATAAAIQPIGVAMIAAPTDRMAGINDTNAARKGAIAPAIQSTARPAMLVDITTASVPARYIAIAAVTRAYAPVSISRPPRMNVNAYCAAHDVTVSAATA